MSLNQIIYKNPGDTIDDTLNLKANSIQVKGNINVPFINGLPYVGGSVNVGQPYDLLQTDSTGTTPEWTNNIKINDIIVDGDISLNGSTGLTNQAIIKSVGGPVWGNPTINLASIPPGPAESVLKTDVTSTVAWSRDLDLDNINLDQQISLGGNDGTDNQVIVKAGGLPTWGNPVFNLPSIPIGTANQILQTNSTATSAQWTSDIKPVNVDISGNLSFLGGSGVSGNVPIKIGSSQVWGKITPASIASGSAGTLLYSNGTNTLWTNDSIGLSNANLTGDLKLNGLSGLDGQFIKKTGSTQNWAGLSPSDIGNGSSNQVLVTNSIGTASEWNYISENSIVPYFSSANQVLTVNSTNDGAEWKLVSPSSINPGTNGQVLATNGSGQVQWVSPVGPIVVGSPYQLLQTNSTGTATEWTNAIRVSSVRLGSSSSYDLRQYYFSGFTNLPLRVMDVTNINAPVIVPLINIPVNYTIIGNVATLVIPTFNIDSPNVSLVNGNSYYPFVELTDLILLPRAVVAPSNSHQSSITYLAYSYGSGSTTICSVYREYYSYAMAVVEFIKDPTSNYIPNGSHGTPFTYNSSLSTSLFKPFAPITIQYMVDQ